MIRQRFSEEGPGINTTPSGNYPNHMAAGRASVRKAVDTAWARTEADTAWGHRAAGRASVRTRPWPLACTSKSGPRTLPFAWAFARAWAPWDSLTADTCRVRPWHRWSVFLLLRRRPAPTARPQPERRPRRDLLRKFASYPTPSSVGLHVLSVKSDNYLYSRR
jgi:hypothetical protein